MIHEDGDNDANDGDDDEIKWRNNVVEEEDGEQIRFLGGNSSSGTKKYRGSNSNDGGNTRDGVKIAGGVIGSGDEIEISEELKEFASKKLGNKSVGDRSIVKIFIRGKKASHIGSRAVGRRHRSVNN
ncbi:hypothetical protein Tco_1561926 [Tanacetum coccineum]